MGDSLVDRLRAHDAKWQLQCDEWIAAAREKGEVSAEQEALLRKTREAEAANVIEKLEGALIEIAETGKGRELNWGDAQDMIDTANAALSLLRGEGR